MTRRCALVRRERRVERAAGTVVLLHADGADLHQLWPLAESAAPARDLVALQGPRSRDPFHSSGAPTDPRWRDYQGWSWFRRDDLGRPEPASFGDSLEQLESLVLELAAPVVLVGRDTGATLALGAALAFPERLAGVVALGGDWPEIPGWSDSLPRPELPVLRLPADADPHHFITILEGDCDVRRRRQEAGQDLLQAHPDR
jgi:predicted esterase